MTVQQPIALQNAGSVHTAEMLRNAIGVNSAGARVASSLTGRGGIHPALGGQLAVTQQASPTTGVTVAAGACLVPGSESTKQGCYSVVNDAAVNVAMTAAPGSNSRIDTIVVRLQDSAYSGAANTATIESVTGTASASPVAPTLPNNCLALADVLIPAGDTQYTNSQITDRRIYLDAGIIIVRGTSDYPTVTYEGLAIYDMTLQQLLIHDGTSFSVPGQTGAWTTFPFTAGYVDASSLTSSSPAQYRVVGNRVEFRGTVKNTGGTNIATGVTIQIGQMPVGARSAANSFSWGIAQFGTSNPPLVYRSANNAGSIAIIVMYNATWISLDGMGYYTT